MERNRSFTKNIWIWIACSALVHLGVIYLTRARPIVLKNQRPEVLRVDVATRTKKAVQAVKPEVSKGKGESKGVKAAKAAAKHPALVAESPVQNETRPYADLLPRGEAVSGPAASGEGTKPYAGPWKTQIIAEGNNLDAHIDIPLVFRRETASGSATAYLQWVDDRNFEILSLNGHPLIRAALFASLNGPESFRAIQKIAAYFDNAPFKLKLSYQTAYDQYEREFHTEFKVYDREVHIDCFRHPNALTYGGGGIPLPDKDAELAKKRDQMELSRLIESIAYSQVVTHYRVTAP